MQIHDVPVPQMRGEQVVEFMRELDAPALDVQVIAVPKISLDWVPKRFRRLRTRKADQLVEVPTIISYSSLQQRTLEQTIDIPDRGGRGGGGGLQGFSQGQGATACRGAATFQFLKVVEGWAVEVFQVSPRNRAQQRFMEQISLTFQFLTVVLEGEVFKVLVQDRVQQPLHLALVLQMKLGKGVFALSPWAKKCGVRSALGVGTGCGL